MLNKVSIQLELLIDSLKMSRNCCCLVESKFDKAGIRIWYVSEGRKNFREVKCLKNIQKNYFPNFF